MSWYTNTYVGLMDKDGKIIPWGPYTADGKLKPIFSHSRSFTTCLNELFYVVQDENVTDELRKAFPEMLDEEYSDMRQYFGYLPESEIPSGEYIKREYCLLSDINAYLSNKEYFVGFEDFYDTLTPTEYAMKLENELKFGVPKPQLDCEGNEITQHSCAEYAYFAYPDTVSVEYDGFLLRGALGMLEDYSMESKGYKYVILKTEG